MKVFQTKIIKMAILSATLIIIELSLDNIENSRFIFVLGSYIRTIPPQATQRISQKSLPKI